MTASAFCSLSLQPPLVLVCVKKGNHTHKLLEEAGAYAINLLDEAQESVSNRFAGWWEEGKSKWADLEISRGAVSGAALIGGSLASLDCTLHSVLDGGDHSICGEVQNVVLNGEDRDALKPCFTLREAIGPSVRNPEVIKCPRLHAVVTGGGRGIGAETARRFKELGYRVTVMARTRND